jgi:hypothetical protein
VIEACSHAGAQFVMNDEQLVNCNPTAIASLFATLAAHRRISHGWRWSLPNSRKPLHDSWRNRPLLFACAQLAHKSLRNYCGQ